MRIGWRLVIAGAAGAAAWLAGAGPAAGLAIAVLAPIVLASAPRFLAAAVAAMRTPTAREDPTNAMSGTEFEDYVARIARSTGNPVIMTSLTGDWGVDIIVGRRPHRLAIQCKRQSRPVGAAAVQQVVAGAPMQDCTRTMVVTNHDFTPAARKLAQLHGCELVGGADLPRLRATIRRLTAPDVPDG